MSPIPTGLQMRMSRVISPRTIRIEHLAKTGDREDFLVHLDDDHNHYRFRLSLTGTIVAIWDVDDFDLAAEYLVDRLVYSHGTAGSFAEEGFWFDSNNSSPSFEETLHNIENQGYRAFEHPSIRTELGAELFGVIEDLDSFRTTHIDGQTFFRSLDEVFERSQAGDDFESIPSDHAGFIYRVCLASSVIDRFDFAPHNQSLNNVKRWLTERVGAERAAELTRPFFMIKGLRKQYPIHEEYEVDAAGVRRRRHEVEEAEAFFGLRGDPTADWHAVRSGFVQALKDLRTALDDLAET